METPCFNLHICKPHNYNMLQQLKTRLEGLVFRWQNPMKHKSGTSTESYWPKQSVDVFESVFLSLAYKHSLQVKTCHVISHQILANFASQANSKRNSEINETLKPEVPRDGFNPNSSQTYEDFAGNYSIPQHPGLLAVSNME